MRRSGALIPLAAALLLAGCSSVSVESAAETCGGESAGITVTDDLLEYDQSADTTRDAWTCLLPEIIADKADQYTITQTLDAEGVAHDDTFDGISAVWGVHADRGIQMSFWRTLD